MRAENYEVILLIFKAPEWYVPFIFNHEQYYKSFALLIRWIEDLIIFPLLIEQSAEGIVLKIPEIIIKSGQYNTMNELTASILDNEKIMSYIGKPDEQKYIWVSGIESHGYLLKSTMSLLEEGFNCVVLEDCVGWQDKLKYASAMEQLRKAGAKLLSTERAINELYLNRNKLSLKELSYLIKKIYE